MKSMKKHITPLERYRDKYYNDPVYRNNCRVGNRKRMNIKYAYEKNLKHNDKQMHIYYCSSYLYNPKSKISLATNKLLS